MYTPVRIVIADDHEIFRNGFKLLLKNQREVELVGEAENGKDLLKQVEAFNPDVVITDIKMPEQDGIEASKQLRREHPHVGIIALSMFNEDHLIVDMLEAGARGYLLKNTTKHELLQAVRTVCDGGTYYCSATSERLTRLIAESRFNPYKQAQRPQFTQREIDIIRLMCRQKTSKEMATITGLSERTIEGYREKIQEKTDAKNAIGIVVYALKNEIITLGEL